MSDGRGLMLKVRDQVVLWARVLPSRQPLTAPASSSFRLLFSSTSTIDFYLLVVVGGQFSSLNSNSI
jgi:hypothetical protein